MDFPYILTSLVVLDLVIIVIYNYKQLIWYDLYIHMYIHVYVYTCIYMYVFVCVFLDKNDLNGLKQNMVSYFNQ